MKEVLIIFIILLILLLMVSVLGGSIRLKSDEHFDDDISLYDETLLPSSMKPWESHPTFIPYYNKQSAISHKEEHEKSNDKNKNKNTNVNANANAIVDVDVDVEEEEKEVMDDVILKETMEYSYNEFEEIPTQESEVETASLYMSDPYQYEEESMKEVTPYARMSDFAGLE